MKYIKWLLIIVVGLIAIILVVAAFLPAEKYFSSSVVINSSHRIPFYLVNDFKNWEKWSPFHDNDSAMVSEFSGSDSGVGAFWKWTSKVNGNGSMAIVGSIYNQNVTYELDFGYGTKDSSWFFLERVPEGTKITWSTKIVKVGYPMGRLMWMAFGDMMGQTFLKGLNKMKVYVESLPADCKTGEITESLVPKKSFIALTDSIATQEIGNFLGSAYGLIGQFIESNRLKIQGAPVAFYNGDPTQPTWVITAAMPILKAPQKTSGNLFIMNTVDQKVVSASHFGDYNTSADTYYKLEDYINLKGLTVSGVPWEEYLNSPATISDPLQLETKIYFPVK